MAMQGREARPRRAPARHGAPSSLCLAGLLGTSGLAGASALARPPPSSTNAAVQTTRGICVPYNNTGTSNSGKSLDDPACTFFVQTAGQALRIGTCGVPRGLLPPSSRPIRRARAQQPTNFLVPRVSWKLSASCSAAAGGARPSSQPENAHRPPTQPLRAPLRRFAAGVTGVPGSACTGDTLLRLFDPAGQLVVRRATPPAFHHKPHTCSVTGGRRGCVWPTSCSLHCPQAVNDDFPGAGLCSLITVVAGSAGEYRVVMGCYSTQPCAGACWIC